MDRKERTANICFFVNGHEVICNEMPSVNEFVFYILAGHCDEP